MSGHTYKKIRPVDDTSSPEETGPVVYPEISRDYLLAGKASFSVQNTVTKVEMSFKVYKSANASEYYVWVWCIERNDFRSLGLLNTATGSIKVLATTDFLPESPEYRTAVWAIQSVFGKKPIPARYRINHHGRCGRCARSLKKRHLSQPGIHSSCETPGR